jgi:acetyltransferase
MAVAVGNDLDSTCTDLNVPSKTHPRGSTLPDWSQRLVLRDGREVTLRTIADTDAPAVQRAFDNLSSESRYNRFLQYKKRLDPAALARGIHPRPGEDFVLVATVPQRAGIDIVGGAQYVRANPADDSTCEFAITVAEDWRGCGLARELLTALMQQARRDQYVAMTGRVLSGNAPMLALARQLGFTVERSESDSAVQVIVQLAPEGIVPSDTRAPT